MLLNSKVLNLFITLVPFFINYCNGLNSAYFLFSNDASSFIISLIPSSAKLFKKLITGILNSGLSSCYGLYNNGLFFFE